MHPGTLPPRNNVAPGYVLAEVLAVATVDDAAPPAHRTGVWGGAGGFPNANKIGTVA